MADVSGTLTGSSDAQLQDMKRKDAGSEEKKEDREIESVTIHQPPSISAKVEKPKKVEEEGEAEKSIQKTCRALCQCLCTIGLCVLFSCTSSCCGCVGGKNKENISFYLGNGLSFLAPEIKRRFKPSSLPTPAA